MQKTFSKLALLFICFCILSAFAAKDTNKLSAVNSDKAPKAIGPYSQAIKCGDMVYCSGQIGLDPATGTLVDGGISAQTTQALLNLGNVLNAAGSGFANVAKVTIYMVDLKDFAAVNEIYAKSFPDIKPARSTVQVAALPKGALIEIECMATVK